MPSGMIKTTTGLRGRLVPSPSPFRGLYNGRLAATVIKSDDFGRKPKIYQMAFRAVTILSFSVPSAWSLSPSAGAGSYTLHDIPGGREKTLS